MALSTWRNPRLSGINPHSVGIVRVISGKFRSRRLKGTPPLGIRPTSDKLKETIFNILGPGIQNSIFLDGCAGMGGIGIEAISRGATFVYFVEQSRKACQIIRENLKSLKVEEGYKIIETDLLKALNSIDTALDIAFVRSEERRVGKECRSRWAPDQEKNNRHEGDRWRGGAGTPQEGS